MLLAVFRELFPVLAALYLIEAAVWVRRAQVLFAPRLAGGFRLKERGLRLASLWPGDFAFLVLRPPVIPERDGVYLFEAEDGPARFDPESWAWISWQDLPAMEVDGEALRFGPSRALKLPAAADAAALFRTLGDLRRLDPAQRERRIGEISAAAFDLGALKKRQSTVLRKTALLRWQCYAFFTFLLALLPLVLYVSPQPSPFLLPVLAMAGASYLSVLAIAAFAARRLRREGVPIPGWVMLSMVFSPPAAVHAASSLSRDLLRGFDPMTGAAALLRREDLVRIARAELHGTRSAKDRGGEPGWRHGWSERERLLSRLFEQAGVKNGELLAAPEKRDPAAESYCPFCESEYRGGFATCGECGLPLLDLPSK